VEVALMKSEELLLELAREAIVEIEDDLAIDCSCPHRAVRVVLAALVAGVRLRALMHGAGRADCLREAARLDERWRALLPEIHRRCARTLS
jgi:hypothetical protein